MGHIQEDRGGLTKADLDDLLTSIGFKLDGDTISALSEVENPQIDLTSFRLMSENIKLNTDQLKNAIPLINGMIEIIKSREARGRDTSEPLAELRNLASQIKEEFGLDLPKDENGNYAKITEEAANKMLAAAEEFIQAANLQAIQKDQAAANNEKGGGTVGKIAAAVVGLRTLYAFVRRIAANNEKLTSAVANLTASIAAVLEPILSFLAALINTFAGWLSKLFGVSAKTGKTVKSIGASVKQLASFDEINNIGGGSGGGGGAGGGGVDAGNLGWFSQMLDGIVQIIKGILQIIANAITLAFVGPIAIVQLLGLGVAKLTALLTAFLGAGIFASITAIITAVKGIFTTILTLIGDLVGTVFSFFTGLSDGFQKAREEGLGIIASVAVGLWEAIKNVFSNLWTTIKNLFTNIWTTIKNTVKTFVTNFKNSFQTILKFINDKIITPLSTHLTNLWTKTIKPILDGIVNGWNTIKNGFSKLLSGIKGMINSVIKVINKIPGVNIPLLAKGGMVPNGQLFIANENGPELVGTMNGSTTVANNAQIIEGIKRGVMEAMSAYAGNGGDQNINLFLDGRQIADVVVKNIRKQGRVLGEGLL